MMKNRNPVLDFMFVALALLAIYSVFQVSSLFKTYSVISRVNVGIVEMIENGNGIDEVSEYVNNELFRRGHRGDVTFSGESLRMLSEAEFDEVKDGKVVVEVKYFLHLPFEILKTSELTMISKR